jgi:hypothetical protein
MLPHVPTPRSLDYDAIRWLRKGPNQPRAMLARDVCQAGLSRAAAAEAGERPTRVGACITGKLTAGCGRISTLGAHVRIGGNLWWAAYRQDDRRIRRRA